MYVLYMCVHQIVGFVDFLVNSIQLTSCKMKFCFSGIGCLIISIQTLVYFLLTFRQICLTSLLTFSSTGMVSVFFFNSSKYILQQQYMLSHLHVPMPSIDQQRVPAVQIGCLLIVSQ